MLRCLGTTGFVAFVRRAHPPTILNRFASNAEGLATSDNVASEGNVEGNVNGREEPRSPANVTVPLFVISRAQEKGDHNMGADREQKSVTVGFVFGPRASQDSAQV